VASLLSASLAEFQARIRRTILELEDHARTIPADQQQRVEQTICRLKAVLDDDSVPEQKSRRSPQCD
jgi:hypothetical protein